MLAAVFVTSGIDVLRNPGPRVAKAEAVTPLAAKMGLPKDTEMLVKLNAATHVAAGSLLALGKFRRMAALALAVSLVPTTYAGHRFWDEDDPAEREKQRMQFLKNMAMLGGLILEAVDTEGRPSVGWLARRAARSVAASASAPVARTAHAAGKAQGVSALSRRAGRLAKKAAKADLAAKAAGQGKRAAKKAAESDLVTTGAARARNLAGKAAKADLAVTGMGKARDLAETAAKADLLKDLAAKALDVADVKGAAAVGAVGAAARRMATAG